MEFSKEGLGEYVTDQDAEMHGIRVKISDTVSFRIRRAGGRNLEYERALARHSRPYLRRIRNNAMDNAELKQVVLIPTYVDAIILGWEGIRDVEGNLVPYSKKACTDFFRHAPAGMNVFDDLVAVAGEMSAFRQQELEEVAEAAGES